MTATKALKQGWPGIALALALPVAAAPAPAPPAQAQAARILTEESRSLVSARVGVPVEIRLRSQSGTGFSWVPTRPVPGLTRMKPAKGASRMPGSAQFQRFRFVAKTPGTYRLTFSYDQSWSGGTKGARTKAFIIIAR